MTPSVRTDNRYRFHCPVVGRDEFYLACVMRRYKHWRGERIPQGECAACMSAGKCPGARMIEMECREGQALFFDPKGQVVHRIPKQVAERIENIVVLPFHFRHREVAPEMIERITGIAAKDALARIAAYKDGEFRPTRVRARVGAPRAEAKAGDPNDLSAAVEMVDMNGAAAAITEAVAGQ